MKKTGNYDMRSKPSIWEEGLGDVPSELYAVVLDVSAGLDKPHQPLILLTRTPLPKIPEFPLFLSRDRRTHVHATPVLEAIPVSKVELDKLTGFTLRIFKDVFNKKYESEVARMSYWIAPALEHSSGDCEHGASSNLLDWSIVNFVHDNPEIKWTRDMPDETLLDKFLVDEYDGGKRFFSTRLAPEYKPLDPVPENTARSKWNANILDYTVSLWSKSRTKRIWDTEQPVIEADKVRHRRNMLAEPHHKEAKEERLPTRCFICPQPLRISPVSSCISLGATNANYADFCSYPPKLQQRATPFQP